MGENENGRFALKMEQQGGDERTHAAITSANAMPFLEG